MKPLDLNDIWYFKNRKLATLTGSFDLTKLDERTQKQLRRAVETGVHPHRSGLVCRLINLFGVPVLFSSSWIHLDPLQLRCREFVQALKEFSVADLTVARMAHNNTYLERCIPWDGKSNYLQVFRPNGVTKRMRKISELFTKTPEYQEKAAAALAALESPRSIEVTFD